MINCKKCGKIRFAYTYNDLVNKIKDYREAMDEMDARTLTPRDYLDDETCEEL